MNILVIEVSTSSAKTLLYSSELGVQAVYSKPFDKKICDLQTQEPVGVYRSIIECIKNITSANLDKIDAISICTTWHSLLFLDKNRNPVGRIITWANNRAAGSIKKYRQDIAFREWYYKKTGCMVHSTYPLWQYIYYRDRYPQQLKEIAYLSSQQEFIFEKLTGEIAISRSIASGSGFFNVHTLDWDDEILEFAGIKRSQLSELKEPTYMSSLKEDIAKELNLPSGIPVIIGGPDGAMNQVGSGAVKKGVMTLSVGTSGALRLTTGKPLIARKPETWCYYLGEGKRIAGAATSGAGNCVNWFVENVSGLRNLRFNKLEQLLDDVKIEDAPIFMPFLYGERCPGWRDERSSQFYGLKAGHRIEDLYFSVLEGILFNLYQCYRILDSFPNVVIKEIRLSGGILNSERWTKMVADIFQREIMVCDFKHQSLLGAAVLALKALGEIDSLTGFESLLGKKVLPDKTLKDLHEERFKRYLKIYHT